MKQEFLARCRALARRVWPLSLGAPVRLYIRIKKGALVRFTNNGVHQNGFQDLFHYTLILPHGKGFAFVESNDLSAGGLRSAVERLLHQSSFRKDTAMATPLPSGRPSGRAGAARKEWFPFELDRLPVRVARIIKEAVRLIRRYQASANGYYSAYHRFFYLADARGLERWHPATAVRFGITALKGEGKGYLSFYHPEERTLNVTDIVEGAVRLAERSAEKEIRVPPGIYECVFSPRALLELLDPLRRHFDARLTEDGKSVFSRLLGKKIFSTAFSMSDDVTHPGQFGIPFDMEGVSKKKVPLIQQGVLSGLLGEGHSTQGISEHPFNAENLVVEGGGLSLEDLFKRIQKGIFVNKIWYHTLVREDRMEVSGLATAGSLFLEKGKIQGRVVHLRYHDSLFSILASVSGATKEQILLKDGERGAALFPYLWMSRLRVV